MKRFRTALFKDNGFKSITILKRSVFDRAHIFADNDRFQRCFSFEYAAFDDRHFIGNLKFRNFIREEQNFRSFRVINNAAFFRIIVVISEEIHFSEVSAEYARNIEHGNVLSHIQYVDIGSPVCCGKRIVCVFYIAAVTVQRDRSERIGATESVYFQRL